MNTEHCTLCRAIICRACLSYTRCCAALRSAPTDFKSISRKKNSRKKPKKKSACRLIIIPFGFMCAGRMSRYMCLFVQCNVFLVCVYIEWNQCESNECLLCEILTLIRRFNSEQYTRTEIQDKERENTTWKKASNLSTQFYVCVCVWSEKKIS